MKSVEKEAIGQRTHNLLLKQTQREYNENINLLEDKISDTLK